MESFVERMQALDGDLSRRYRELREIHLKAMVAQDSGDLSEACRLYEAFVHEANTALGYAQGEILIGVRKLERERE